MIKNFLRFLFIYLAIVIVFIFFSGLAINGYYKFYSNKDYFHENTILDIPKGSSVKKVCELLFQNNLINNQNAFYWYLRLGRDDGDKIQAGYYEFFGNITLKEIADRLLFGREKSYLVIIKEGQNLLEIAQTLEDSGLVSLEQFESAMNNSDILKQLNIPKNIHRQYLKNDTGGIEGYLFPDSYYFNKKQSAEEIILTMHNRLLEKLNSDIENKIIENNMTLHEVLTLASIVEKETGNPNERALVASVYLNRLRIKMPLQADPTVIYGLKDFEGRLLKKDLKALHPYNTYKIRGIPPGPIASAGIESIKAVLWPEDTNFLYFVSKNDGSHEFCPNLNCHNKAVEKWQRNFVRN